MSVLPDKPAPNGFTLLEIMVALAIFSLAALAMVRLQGYSVRSTANLGASSMAWQVARNVAVEILSNPAPPTLGETQGDELNGGQNWRWTANTERPTMRGSCGSTSRCRAPEWRRAARKPDDRATRRAMIQARPSEAGFTLVELLVALAIFALISVAGVTLLRSGSDTQLAVKDRLEDLSRSNRLANAIEGDLAQAVARPVRDQAGEPVPAFIQEDASTPGSLFGFVRAGWSNFDEAPRPRIAARGLCA